MKGKKQTKKVAFRDRNDPALAVNVRKRKVCIAHRRLSNNPNKLAKKTVGISDCFSNLCTTTLVDATAPVAPGNITNKLNGRAGAPASNQSVTSTECDKLNLTNGDKTKSQSTKIAKRRNNRGKNRSDMSTEKNDVQVQSDMNAGHVSELRSDNTQHVRSDVNKPRSTPRAQVKVSNLVLATSLVGKRTGK